MAALLLVNAPSLKTGSEKRLVVAIGTTQAVVLEGFLEVLADLRVLLRRGVDGDQVVVVEVDAVRADFAEQVDDLHGGDGFADGPAERVAAGVADGPEAEGEFHFGVGGEVGHGGFLVSAVLIRDAGERREGEFYRNGELNQSTTLPGRADNVGK